MNSLSRNVYKDDETKTPDSEEKFEVYIRTRDEQAAIGEILREYGVYTSDLREIEQSVEHWEIHGLKQKKNPNEASDVDKKDLKALQAELYSKVRALADLTVEHMLLKKRQIGITSDLTHQHVSGEDRVHLLGISSPGRETKDYPQYKACEVLTLKGKTRVVLAEEQEERKPLMNACLTKSEKDHPIIV